MVSPVISQYAFINNSLIFSIMLRILVPQKALSMPSRVLEYGQELHMPMKVYMNWLNTI